MPNAPKTPSRNVRVPDRLWQAALEVSAERSESVADVVRRALETYVHDDTNDCDWSWGCKRGFREHVGDGEGTCVSCAKVCSCF